MNKGSQPSVNSLCCFSTVALANRDGTTSGLFIPRFILLTIGNSGTVAGRISFSSVASSSLFTNSKLIFHAGFSGFLVRPPSGDSDSRTWDKSQWGLHAFPHPTLQMPPEIEHYQLGIFHLPKEHCITHSCPQHFLSTPVQRRPIQHAY